MTASAPKVVVAPLQLLVLLLVITTIPPSPQGFAVEGFQQVVLLSHSFATTSRNRIQSLTSTSTSGGSRLYSTLEENRASPSSLGTSHDDDSHPEQQQQFQSPVNGYYSSGRSTVGTSNNYLDQLSRVTLPQRNYETTLKIEEDQQVILTNNQNHDSNSNSKSNEQVFDRFLQVNSDTTSTISSTGKPVPPPPVITLAADEQEQKDYASSYASESEQEIMEKFLQRNAVEENRERSEPNGDDSYKYVLVGDTSNSTMDADPMLQYVRSEVNVWKYFREERRRRQQRGGIPLDVIASRTLDTAQDVFLQLQRKVSQSMGAAGLTPEQDATRKTVVLLGSGWAAHAFMKVADCRKLRIIVISPVNHFVFTPMLASAAVGSVEYRSMTEAVRVTNPYIHDYIEGKAMDIDIHQKVVTVKLNRLTSSRPIAGETNDAYIAAIAEAQAQMMQEAAPTIQVSYDHLIVAVGSKVARRNVPGAKEYAYKLKTTAHAKELRQAVGECFEYAARPDVADANDPDQVREQRRRVTFLIAGAGPTGVELAGELWDLFADITRPVGGTYPKLKNAVRVILCASGPDLVPQFEQPLRDAALKSLREKGVEVYLNTRVNEITPTMARISVRGYNQNGYPLVPKEENIPIGLAIWCAGTTPVRLVENLLQRLPPEARNRDGRIRVDRWMRPPMPDPSLLGTVLVMGDAAAQPTSDFEEDGPLPATAQVAGQQGAFLARTLSRNYNLTTTPPKIADVDVSRYPEFNVFYDPGLTNWLTLRGLEESPPFTFLNLGMLAYVGGNEALSQVQLGDTKVISQSGSTGFLLWRSVYLAKQVATRNRALVTFDWLKTSVFGRDITRL